MTREQGDHAVQIFAAMMMEGPSRNVFEAWKEAKRLAINEKARKAKIKQILGKR